MWLSCGVCGWALGKGNLSAPGTELESGGGIKLVRGFELKDHLAGPGAAEPFVAEGRTRDVAAEPFEFLSLLGTTTGIGMQAKPLGTDAALWL